MVATGLVLVGPVALGAGAAGAVPGTADTVAAVAAGSAVGQEAGELRLVSASPVVAADGTFTARIDLGSLAAATGLDVGVTVYTVLEDATGLDQPPSRPIHQLPARPLDDFPVDADGVLTVDVPIRGGEPFDDVSRIRIPDAGIYPVVIDLRDGQGEVASLRIDLIRLPAATATRPDQPVASRPVALTVAVGGRGLSVTAATELLRRHRSLPLTVVLGPGVLDRLPAEGGAVRDLRAAVGTRPVVAAVEPDLDPSALAAIGQGDIYLQAVAATADAVARLGFVVDRTVVVTTTPLTADGADLVVRAGAAVAVELGTPTVAPDPGTATGGTGTATGGTGTATGGTGAAGTVGTPSGPLAVVSLETGREAADPASPTPAGGPVGVAHHRLAHLMSRAPGGPPQLLGGFGPVGASGDGTFGDADVLGVLFDLLESTGAADPAPPADPPARPFTVLDLADAARTRAEGELAVAAAPANDLGPVAEAVASNQDLLATYDGYYADGPFSPADYRTRLARDLAVDRTTEERGLDLFQMGQELNDDLKRISLPGDQSVTLAARRAPIPLTIDNQTGGTRNVLVTFRGVNVTVADNNRLIPVPPGVSSIDVEVEARSLGESPLVVTIRTPDGRHVLSTTQFKVRSTAVPGVGLAISAAGLAGLAVWWYVSIKRNRANGGRRRRRGRDPDDGGGDGGGGPTAPPPRSGRGRGNVVTLPVDGRGAGDPELDRTGTLVGDSVVP